MSNSGEFKKAIFGCLMVVLFLAGLLAAGETERSYLPWTVEDVINQERALSFQISPDGSRVVWVKNIPDREKDKRISHLFLSFLDREEPTIQLTRGSSSNSNPKWSPDRQKIAYLSGRTDLPAGSPKTDDSQGQQLWLLDLRGGEPQKVTSLETGVIAYDWVDNDHFLILAREPKTLLEIKAKEKKDSSIVYEDQENMIPQRLFIYCLKEKTWNRLTENNDQITSFVLSPDKKLVVTRNNQSLSYEVDRRVKPKYFLIKLTDKSSLEIFPNPFFKPSGIY